MTTATIPEADGVYPDVDEIAYHNDHSSLSCSGAKQLLRSPYKFNWQRTQPRKEKAAYDLGHYVHGKALGVGQPVVIIDAADYKTTKAREQRDDAYAIGSVPILAKVAEQGDAMVKRLLEHPVSGALLANNQRLVENSIYWHDPMSNVRLRARPDVIAPAGDWLVIGDVKTTAETADPEDFGAVVARRGYYLQDPFYSTAAAAAGLGQQIDFIFMVVEVEPPHLVSINRLTPRARDVGRSKMRHAIDTYAECSRTNQWPDYGPAIHDIDLPNWFYYQEEE